MISDCEPRLKNREIAGKKGPKLKNSNGGNFPGKINSIVETSHSVPTRDDNACQKGGVAPLGKKLFPIRGKKREMTAQQEKV